MVRYNPKEYWSKRRHPNPIDELNGVEKSIIKKYARGDVLDYGVGIGRCFEAYSNVDSVVGVDIVETYKNVAISRAQRQGLKFKHIVINESDSIPFADKTFDVVVSMKVLQHVPLGDVEAVIIEMQRVADVVVIYNGVIEEPTKPHCFVHNYRKIIEDNNFNIIDKGNLYYVFE